MKFLCTINFLIIFFLSSVSYGSSLVGGLSSQKTMSKSSRELKLNEDNSKIEILFMYLPSTLKHYSKDDLDKEIEKSIRDANEVFHLSEVPITLVNAGLKRWSASSYDWSGARAPDIYKNMKPIVNQLWQDGAFYKHGADVLFLVDHRDPEDKYCGWASIDRKSSILSEEKTNSFGVLRLGRGCSGGNRAVLAHEVGHLMGAAHGYFDELRSPSHLGYGVECGGKGTMMHPHATRHRFFSNPKILMGGEACGYHEEADNSKLFTEIGPLLAKKSDLNEKHHSSKQENFLQDSFLIEDQIFGEAATTENEASSIQTTEDQSPNSGGSSDQQVLLILIIGLFLRFYNRSSRKHPRRK